MLTELRYVDERFAARWPRHAWFALGALLLGIAAVRTAGLAGLGSAGLRTTIELGLGAAAVGLTLAVGRGLARWLGGALVATLVVGLARAPAMTLVLLALLHNLTPVGFLAERLHGPARRWALLGCAAAFVVVPLLMVVSLPLPPVSSGPFGTGDLEAHLPVFVPAPWCGGPFADRLFAVAAWWQCVHYALVLHVLPRLGGGEFVAGASVRWPSSWAFTFGATLLGIVLAAGFVAGFGHARAAYGIVAAMHAWIELPVLVLAVAGTAGGATPPARAAVCRAPG